ncbi:hypothetical protein NDU88_005540 [Pleurodeles waltl]|uniref:Uncharacterized protein n=1 Tax=Pleurodeles waltl TaxID=8319 RepID=A0AAV7MWP3_PLEWA|nr:hypothetical protein NDU88_005540 [Pleurodeles waltl]
MIAAGTTHFVTSVKDAWGWLEASGTQRPDCHSQAQEQLAPHLGAAVANAGSDCSILWTTKTAPGLEKMTAEHQQALYQAAAIAEATQHFNPEESY